MGKAFGRTWWGNAWVEAMERIDYNTTRLPRGRRYANNGSVKAIEIKDDHVFAKVQGSRPKPYSIRIKLKGFTERDPTNKGYNSVKSCHCLRIRHWQAA